MKIIFLYLSILLVSSSQKCLFHQFSKIIKIPKINLKTNKSFEDHHPLNIYYDYSNILNIKENEKSNIINIFNQVSNILNQLISVKNIQKIKYTSRKICNMNIKMNENIIKGINSDLIIIPLINKSIKEVLGRICLIDKISKRSIIGLLYLPPNLKFNKNQILHQLIHILGFNTNKIQINRKSNVKTFYTYKKLFKNFNQNFRIKSSDWDNDIFIKDIMSNESNYEDISELTLSLLKDKNNYYKFNKCFIYKPIKGNIIYYGTDSNNKLICYLNSKNNIKNNKCGINKYFLKSDIYQKSKNYNFKIYQTLYLLSPSEKCPNKHPRTVWFSNIKKYSNRTIPKKFKIEKFDVTNKDYVVSLGLKRSKACFYVTYKMIERFNGIFRKKNMKKVNFYDDYNFYNAKAILKIIKNFNKYIQYNNFHFIKYLNNKDETYKCYRRMHEKFPKDYTYMQPSYILPDDKEIIKNKFKDYKLSKDNLWIFKPPDLLLGIGIKFLKNFTNLTKKGVITRYIPNPLLLYGKKFDLRLYVLISSFLPLKIYLNKEGLVRVTTTNYNLEEKNFNDPYIHFTHTVVNMRNKNFTHPKNFTDERGNLWSMAALKNYLERNGKNYNKVYNDIKDLVIKSILSAEYIFTKESRKKYFGKKVSTIIGYDILIDENLKPWLLEMNCKCPDLTPHNIVDEIIKTDFVVNYFNLLGLVPISHINKKPFDDVYEYKDKIEEVVDDSLCEFERADGDLERIFPLKDNVDYYKQFFESPGKENELLWEKLKDFD